MLGSEGRAAGLVVRWLAAVALAVAIEGCIYDVPLTANATRRVDTRLVGDWTSVDGQRLTAHAVSSDVIPPALKSSSEARRLLRSSLENARLFADEPLALVRKK